MSDLSLSNGHVLLIAVAVLCLALLLHRALRLRRLLGAVWALAASAVVAMGALALVPGLPGTSAPVTAAAASPAQVTYAKIRPIVAQRCAFCHSMHPRSRFFASPPAGIALDTPAQVRSHASDIEGQVIAKAMPFGNLTRMTQAERNLVVAWIRSGARIR